MRYIEINKYISIILVFLMACFSFSLTATCEKAGQMKSHPNYLFILVAGIGGEKGDFGDNTDGLNGYLVRSLGLGGNVFSYDFTDNLQSCEDNAEELGNRNYSNPQAGMNDMCWIEKAKADYASIKNYSSFEAIPYEKRPGKIIIITHSLGGVGCRYYLTSDYYQDDVKKLITIDSPHLGADGFTWYERIMRCLDRQVEFFGHIGMAKMSGRNE